MTNSFNINDYVACKSVNRETREIEKTFGKIISTRPHRYQNCLYYLIRYNSSEYGFNRRVFSDIVEIDDVYKHHTYEWKLEEDLIIRSKNDQDKLSEALALMLHELQKT